MSNPLDQYMALSEAAKVLGYSSPSSLRAYAIAGRVPGATKLGRNWFIPKSWVKAEQENPTLGATGDRGGQRSKNSF